MELFSILGGCFRDFKEEESGWVRRFVEEKGLNRVLKYGGELVGS